MTRAEVGTVFVCGERVFVVRESPIDAPRSTIMTVTMDGRFEWSFEEPGWRSISFGSSGDRPYVWSARGLIELPRSGHQEPVVIRVDEDLLYVFRTEVGWLLVCETSVRCIVEGREMDRAEFGEVVERAGWDSGRLWVLDAAGQEHRLRVEGSRFTT